MRKIKTIVTSYDEVARNIAVYENDLKASEGLQSRLSQHPAWYAIKTAVGDWSFGPSKFVGYADNSAENYLQFYDRRDGREAEPALREWFEAVRPNSPLEQELKQQFRAFAKIYGKLPHKNWRVSVAKDVVGERVSLTTGGAAQSNAFLSRISINPAVCGGRPCIAGTRMRVTDIVAMVAEGASREEILADFPYITAEDIGAALHYAARATDHRLMPAA